MVSPYHVPSDNERPQFAQCNVGICKGRVLQLLTLFRSIQIVQTGVCGSALWKSPRELGVTESAQKCGKSRENIRNDDCRAGNILGNCTIDGERDD